MVGDPGIEPGMSHLGGVTVRCRTLQPVAQHELRNSRPSRPRQHKIYAQLQSRPLATCLCICDTKNTRRKGGQNGEKGQKTHLGC